MQYELKFEGNKMCPNAVVNFGSSFSPLNPVVVGDLAKICWCPSIDFG